MRKRSLEHIFKHTLLFIAILLPLIIAFSALYAPIQPIDDSGLLGDVENERTIAWHYGSRSWFFMSNLANFFDGLGLRPYVLYEINEYGPNMETEGYNALVYGVFQCMGYLMGEYNQYDCLIGYNRLMTDVSTGEVISEYDLAFPYGGAVVLSQYLVYIFYVYVFYFLIELFLFVPRLGTEFGDKLIHSGHSKGGDVEW